MFAFFNAKNGEKTKNTPRNVKIPKIPQKVATPKKDKGSKDREMQMTSDDSYDSWLVFKF